MRKVSIIAPIGNSPPVITEFLQYVEGVLDQRVTDLTIITTREPLVLEGLEPVKAGIADRYPNVHVHVVELPNDDVDSEERSTDFMGVATRILRDQKGKYGAEFVHLCVSGERKQIYTIISLLAQFYDVNGVYHVVMPDVWNFNQQLKRIRYEAKEFANTEDKLGYYRQKKALLEPVLSPELSAYNNIIKLPAIPYPMRTLIVIKQRKFPLKSIDMDIAFQLRDLEYICITRNHAYTFTDGERLYSIIGSVAG
ncbi:MAG: CRISPR-associated ring nuclease [Nitrososphaeria archaeon]